jgi:NDP-sugar pyrophosphorylase family protein
MKAVILAGGMGTRLHPYTTVFPKPLVPIGKKPILEIVIEQLAKNGIKEIIMAVGHLAELIIAYFGSGEKYGVDIKYSREEKPLGTAGPLVVIKDELSETFLMMNGDILTDLQYSKLIEYHKKSGATATIGITKRNVDIDYGVVEFDGEQEIKKWTEKPTINYHVSMGIYVLEPKAIDYIPKDIKYDLPQLIIDLIKNNEKIKAYPYEGYWLDIGRVDDYQKAINDRAR